MMNYGLNINNIAIIKVGTNKSFIQCDQSCSGLETLQLTVRLTVLFNHYIFILLKVHVLLLTFPRYMYCQNAKSLNFDPFIHSYGYFLRYLTELGCKCLTKEVN